MGVLRCHRDDAQQRNGQQDALALVSRWCQGNFFHDMMEHFAIDALSEYRTEEIPDTNRPVVNPARRNLDRQARPGRSKGSSRNVNLGLPP